MKLFTLWFVIGLIPGIFLAYHFKFSKIVSLSVEKSYWVNVLKELRDFSFRIEEIDERVFFHIGFIFKTKKSAQRKLDEIVQRLRNLDLLVET
jgi:hypothetical protein